MKIETAKLTSKTMCFRTYAAKEVAVTLTEWLSGEGYDVCVDADGTKNISLTTEEISAIIAVYHTFDLKEIDKDE